MSDYIKLKYLKVSQPIGEFYNCVISASELIDITFVDVRRLEQNTEQREVEIFSGIQRKLSPKRVTEIGKYVNTIDATFPSSIILHIDPKNIKIKGDHLQIKNSKEVAKVLDGQHRIAGLEKFDQDGVSFDTIVTIFVGMELEDQALVFATINKTQTKVNKSLVADLFSFARNRSPQKTAHSIVRALDQKEGSPFEGKIKILGTAIDKEKETITQATFSQALIEFYSKDPMVDRDLYKRGKKLEKFGDKELERRPFRNMFVDEKDSDIAQIVWNFFYAVQQKWPNAWNQVRTEMVLNKSTGFLALMRVLRKVYPNLNSNYGVVTKEAFVELLSNVDIEETDLNREIYIPGSSGQSKLFNDIIDQIG